MNNYDNGEIKIWCGSTPTSGNFLWYKEYLPGKFKLFEYDSESDSWGLVSDPEDVTSVLESIILSLGSKLNMGIIGSYYDYDQIYQNEKYGSYWLETGIAIYDSNNTYIGFLQEGSQSVLVYEKMNANGNHIHVKGLKLFNTDGSQLLKENVSAYITIESNLTPTETEPQGLLLKGTIISWITYGDAKIVSDNASFSRNFLEFLLYDNNGNPIWDENGNLIITNI